MPIRRIKLQMNLPIQTRSSPVSLATILKLIFLNLVSLASATPYTQSYLGAFNYSFFDNKPYQQMAAVCYDDKDHAAIGFKESLESDVATKIATVNYYTANLNLTNSLVYFDIQNKAIAQKLSLILDTSGSTTAVFEFTVAKLAEGYQVSAAFERAECSSTIPAAPLAPGATREIKFECNSTSSNVVLTVKISPFDAYECIFQENKTPAIISSKAAPLSGLRIDWNATVFFTPNWRGSFGLESRTMPAVSEINYWQTYRPLEYKIAFGPGDYSGKLKLSLSLFNWTLFQEDQNCLVFANSLDYKCKTCKPNYVLVAGECLCNRGATVETIKNYEMKMLGVAPTNVFQQATCRGLGTGLGSDAQGVCETEIDAILKRNLTLTFNRSLAIPSELNISYTITNSSLPAVLSRCTGQTPKMTVMLSYHGNFKSIGRLSPGAVLVSGKELDTHTSRVDIPLKLDSLLDKLNEYCLAFPVTTTSTLFECQLRTTVGVGATASSAEHLHRLNVLYTAVSGTAPTWDAQVVNLNATRYFFGSVFKTDPNMRLRVYTYNRSNEALAGLPVDSRYFLSELGMFEKNETVRITLDVVNSSMNTRYKISSFLVDSYITDLSPSAKYFGQNCVGNKGDGSYFQQMVLECNFSLNFNVTLTINVTLSKRDTVISPETIQSTHILMFEVYQQRELIKLAGLSKTATIVVIVVTLISMTSLICYLAIKAGAADNIDLEGIKENLKGGVGKIGGMFKKDKEDSKLKEKLLEKGDEESGERKKKKKAPKKKNLEDQDDAEAEISQILKKNDISEIRPVKGQDDSILSGLGKQIKKVGTGAAGDAKAGKGSRNEILEMLDSSTPKRDGFGKKHKPAPLVLDDAEEEADYSKEKAKKKEQSVTAPSKNPASRSVLDADSSKNASSAKISESMAKKTPVKRKPVPELLAEDSDEGETAKAAQKSGTGQLVTSTLVSEGMEFGFDSHDGNEEEDSPPSKLVKPANNKANVNAKVNNPASEEDDEREMVAAANKGKKNKEPARQQLEEEPAGKGPKKPLEKQNTSGTKGPKK